MSTPDRFRRSKHNSKDLEPLQEHRLSKRMASILALLSEHVDGLTKEQIVTTLDPDTKIYDEDGKVNRHSTQYASWSRTILKLVKQGSIIQLTTKTIYKKAP